jgi:tRNA (guanine-1)-methyltransferase
MLLKAQPLIDTINHIVEQNQLQKSDFSILFPSPSQQVFNQKIAYGQSKKDALIFVCGRYEGIDARFEKYCMEHYPDQFKKLSLGQFILLGGELPSCVMIEAITRLIP